jgi:hypothetical protein
MKIEWHRIEIEMNEWHKWMTQMIEMNEWHMWMTQNRDRNFFLKTCICLNYCGISTSCIANFPNYMALHVSGIAFDMNFGIATVIFTWHWRTAWVGVVWDGFNREWLDRLKRYINVPATTCDVFLLEFVRLQMSNIISKWLYDWQPVSVYQILNGRQYSDKS